MRALIWTTYGPPEKLLLGETEKPTPAANEVLIKVRATTVNRTDSALIRAKPFFIRILTGLIRPKKNITGTEFAGEIESVGSQVTAFQRGDRVFGFADLGAKAHAQYLVIKPDNIITMPEKFSYTEAAPSFEGAHYAYNFINKVPLQAGDKVLLNGATGAIGSAALQLLKHFGADVTAVCATKNIERVKTMGSNRVIDYTKEDFTQDSARYDYVFDCVGKSSFFKCYNILKKGGVYISSDLGYLAQNMFLPALTPLLKPFLGNRKTITPFPEEIPKTLQLVKGLIEQGKFKALIDKEYSFEAIIDAFNYVETGEKIGNVVITIPHKEE